MDTTPVTACCLGKYYFTDGDNLERCYKDSLSGFREWGQRGHAKDWVLLPDNMGERLSIDESSLQDDLFTFLTNKDGHCKQGTLIAAVRGTKAEDVLTILLQIPEKERLRVKEVTADLSDTMAVIVHTAFPNATLTLDCFHIMKRCNDAIEDLRLRVIYSVTIRCSSCSLSPHSPALPTLRVPANDIVTTPGSPCYNRISGVAPLQDIFDGTATTNTNASG